MIKKLKSTVSSYNWSSQTIKSNLWNFSHHYDPLNHMYLPFLHYTCDKNDSCGQLLPSVYVAHTNSEAEEKIEKKPLSLLQHFTRKKNWHLCYHSLLVFLSVKCAHTKPRSWWPPFSRLPWWFVFLFLSVG